MADEDEAPKKEGFRPRAFTFDPNNPQGWPPECERVPQASCIRPSFDSELKDSCIELDQDSCVATLDESYRQGTVWLRDSLVACSGGSSWKGGWRELCVTITSPAEKRKGQRLTGGIHVAFSPAQTPASATELQAVHLASNSFGVSLQFLPRLLTLWPSTKASVKKYHEVEICQGDGLRFLVNPEGWCDILQAKGSKWRPILGWQTPLKDSDQVFVGVTLLHTTAVTLKYVYHYDP